ncbi:MAG: VWA domain-containing protein [Prevotella sp.]|nr:VWA domain-containing protein [Prevotella sp.]
MKRVYNLLIVDESGSMEIIRKQAFAGLNETLETVSKLQTQNTDIEQHVTLLTFDSDHKRFLYDDVKGKDVRQLKWNEYCPGGATPLYDAIGMAVSKLNAQTNVGDNVLVTIITDGEENCSREWNMTMVRNLIEKLKGQGWTFTLIGTDNLDVEGMAAAMSIDDHLTFTEDAEETKAMFELDREARMQYNACVAECKPRKIGGHFSRKRV